MASMRPEVEQALSAFRKGETERGLQLLEHTVMSFGMKVCGHREDAEDTAQEVLLKLLPYISKFDNPKAFSVWLYTVAKNRCLMSRRRSKFAPKEHLALDDLMPTLEELDALATPRNTTPENVVLRKEASAQVQAALAEVPPQYRLILVLHDMEGLETAEIAKVTGLREGTVRVRLHRGRLALRKELSAREHGQHRRTSRQVPAKPRNCREIFASLSDYLDGIVEPQACAELEKHMKGCSPCEDFLADLERTVARCRSFDPGCKQAEKVKVQEQLLSEYRRLLKSASKQSA